MVAIQSWSNELQKFLDKKTKSYKLQKYKKLALKLGIQAILTNDGEVCIPSLSSILLAVTALNNCFLKILFKKNINSYRNYDESRHNGSRAHVWNEYQISRMNRQITYNIYFSSKMPLELFLLIMPFYVQKLKDKIFKFKNSVIGSD